MLSQQQHLRKDKRVESVQLQHTILSLCNLLSWHIVDRGSLADSADSRSPMGIHGEVGLLTSA